MNTTSIPITNIIHSEANTKKQLFIHQPNQRELRKSIDGNVNKQQLNETSKNSRGIISLPN